MTVDEILATGRYTDRRGRRFGRINEPSRDSGMWIQWWPEIKPYPDDHLTPDQMRLLIERDQHECDAWGLAACNVHPAVSVTRHRQTGFWLVFDRYGTECVGPEYHEWSDALAAARALAVGE